MVLYCFLLLIVTTFLYESCKSVNSKTRKYLLIVAFITMTFVSGLRDNVGTDYGMYKAFFINSQNLEIFTITLEPLFTITAKITHSLFGNQYFTMFLTFSIVIHYYIFKNAISYSERNYYLTIFLFFAFGFFFSSMNIIRQWVAIVLTIEAAKNFINDEKVKGIIYYIFAILNHYSAILVFPFLIVGFLIKKNKTRLIIVLSSILLFLFGNNINELIYKIVLKFPQFYKYFKYSNEQETSTSIFVMPMFCLLTYILYLVFVDKKTQRINKRAQKLEQYAIPYNCKNSPICANNFIINMVILGFSVSLIGTKIAVIQRVQFYFIVYLIFAITYVIDNLGKTNRKIVVFLIILMGTVFYIYTLIGNGGEPLPYKFVFLDILFK